VGRIADHDITAAAERKFPFAADDFAKISEKIKLHLTAILEDYLPTGHGMACSIILNNKSQTHLPGHEELRRRAAENQDQTGHGKHLVLPARRSGHRA
jgi:hypothetical protein